MERQQMLEKFLGLEVALSLKGYENIVEGKFVEFNSTGDIIIEDEDTVTLILGEIIEKIVAEKT